MSTDIPSILHHISIGTNDFEKAIVFYDAVLSTLGCKRVFDFVAVQVANETSIIGIPVFFAATRRTIVRAALCERGLVRSLHIVNEAA